MFSISEKKLTFSMSCVSAVSLFATSKLMSYHIMWTFNRSTYGRIFHSTVVRFGLVVFITLCPVLRFL